MILAKIKAKVQPINSFRKLVIKEFKNPAPISILNRIKCYKNGFFSNSYILFDFKRNDYRQYISDFQENIKTQRLNNSSLYVDNKIIFKEIVSPYALIANEDLILVEGNLLSLNQKSSIQSIANLLEHIASGNPVIFKPIDGASGIGIIKCEYKDGGYYWNQIHQSEAEILEQIKQLSDYIISAVIIQSRFSENLYPDTVNTIRILTIIDPDTKNPYIASAAHRIGNSNSYPVDNCSSGGLTAKIDIESGILEKAASTIIVQGKVSWFNKHPDTGNRIEGTQIPDWENIKSTIIKIAKHIKFLPFIGWDVVITRSNEILILEANVGPDLKLHQVHEPLLDDDRNKKFFKHHGVI